VAGAQAAARGEDDEEATPDPFAQRLQISIGGESVHITDAISQVTYFPAATAAPNVIGVTDEGVEGAGYRQPNHELFGNAFFPVVKTLARNSLSPLVD